MGRPCSHARTSALDPCPATSTLADRACRRHRSGARSTRCLLVESTSRPARPHRMPRCRGRCPCPLVLSSRNEPRPERSRSGRDRRRSGDPTLFRRVLCQLSYSTVPGRVLATRPIPQKSHSSSLDDEWPPAAVPTGLEPATSGLTGRRELQTSPRDQICTTLSRRTPNGIRTRAATLKGWCPRPLDDGGLKAMALSR